MKRQTNKTPTKKWTIFLTIAFFTLTTLLTLQEKTAVDGFNEYGLPFRFYTFTNSNVIENIEQTGFDL